MTSLSNHHSILSLYGPIDPVWGDITQLLKPKQPTPTISATPDFEASNSDRDCHDAITIFNTPATNHYSDEKLDDNLKESWNKGREYGLQEAAMKQARKEAADRRAMKIVIGVVVDIAPSVWDTETDGEIQMDKGDESGSDKEGEVQMGEEVEVETEKEVELATEKNSSMEVVIWTPDTSNKDTDEEDTEEGDLLDFDGPDNDNLVSSEADVHDKVVTESVKAMTLETDVIASESKHTNTTNEDLGLHNAPIDTNTTKQPTTTNNTAPTDPLFTRFGIPSQSTIHPIEPNFYTTRTIPPYPLDGDIKSESSDALLVGPISDSAFNAWTYDDGRKYIMDKVGGVFSTVFLRKAPGERYIRVEFHSRYMRDKALRALGGVVDERKNSFFLKGGYPCGGTIMFAWKWREAEAK